MAAPNTWQTLVASAPPVCEQDAGVRVKQAGGALAPSSARHGAARPYPLLAAFPAGVVLLSKVPQVVVVVKVEELDKVLSEWGGERERGGMKTLSKHLKSITCLVLLLNTIILLCLPYSFPLFPLQ